MKVLFIEDEPDHVAKSISVLRSTELFESVENVLSYRALDDLRIRETDLFVLDVLVDRKDEDFLGMVKNLRRIRKPFIAFTTITENHRMESVPGRPAIRHVVLEHGGLRLITKSRSHDDAASKSSVDIQLDLAEAVLQFYWSNQRK